MEHMKRMLMILVAVVIVGVMYMYVVPCIMKHRAGNVEVQAYDRNIEDPISEE